MEVIKWEKRITPIVITSRVRRKKSAYEKRCLNQKDTIQTSMKDTAKQNEGELYAKMSKTTIYKNFL